MKWDWHSKKLMLNPVNLDKSFRNHVAVFLLYLGNTKNIAFTYHICTIQNISLWRKHKLFICFLVWKWWNNFFIFLVIISRFMINMFMICIKYSIWYMIHQTSMLFNSYKFISKYFFEGMIIEISIIECQNIFICVR